MDRYPHMEIVQVVLDRKLLKEADRAAQKSKINRSALIREALRSHLQGIHRREMEERDRAGYRASAGGAEEGPLWEREAAWPED